MSELHPYQRLVSLRSSMLTSTSWHDCVCVVTEAFVVCQNYSPPKDYVPNMSNPLLDHHYGLYSPFLITLVCTVLSWSLWFVRSLLHHSGLCSPFLITMVCTVPSWSLWFVQSLLDHYGLYLSLIHIWRCRRCWGVDLGGRRIIKKIFFQAEDGIRDTMQSRGLGDVYKRQGYSTSSALKKTNRSVKRMMWLALD